ncbi:MAG: efflux RND transporter periplasmic adaptor subunit [Luteimonas sp.]
MIRIASAPVFAAALIVTSCSGSNSAPTPAPTALVREVPVETRLMQRHLSAYGTVDYAPDAKRTVSTPGDVQIEAMMVRAGDAIVDGQPLIRVRATATALQELHKTQADLTAAQQEMARVGRLYEQHLATNADRTAAQQALANAQGAQVSAAQRLGADGSRTIRASGTSSVVSVDASVGDTVNAGGALLHLARSDQLYVRLGIEPTDIATVHPGQTVELQAAYAGAAPVAGTVTSVNPQIDPQLQLAQALINLEATNGLLPNATVHAQIIVERRDSALAVPRAAVLYDGDTTYVFVAASGKAHRVQVRTGIEDGDLIQITAGLHAGQQVIAEGNHELQDGMAIRIADNTGQGNGNGTSAGALHP